MDSHRHGKISRILAPILLLAFAVPLRADYLYTVSFSSLTLSLPQYGADQTYAADSFSFSVPELITPAGTLQTIPTPGAELNGLSIQSVDAFLNYGLTLEYEAPGWSNLPSGSVGGLFFTTDVFPTQVGTYASTAGAGRMIVLSFERGALGDFFYRDGSLTIAQLEPSVPEPAAWAWLMGSAVVCLGAWRRARR